MGVYTHQKHNGFNTITRTSDVILNILFILVVIICICPVVLVTIVSFTSESSINKYGYSFIPKEFSTLAYRYVLSDVTQIARSYGVSLFVTIVGSALAVLIVAMYAYPISRRDFKHKGLFTFIVFFTMLFSGGLVPWYMVYSSLLQLKNTVAVLIMPHLVTPFYVLIMKTFFSTNIPDSIVESAKMDGAGEIRIFVSIVLKLSTPALATIGLFSTIYYWNDWFNAMMFITDIKMMPLQFLLYRIQTTMEVLIQLSSSTGQVLTVADLPSQSVRMAMCVITMGPIILAYPFFQKYFVKGLTIGAIKG